MCSFFLAETYVPRLSTSLIHFDAFLQVEVLIPIVHRRRPYTLGSMGLQHGGSPTADLPVDGLGEEGVRTHLVHMYHYLRTLHIGRTRIVGNG